MQKQHSRDTSPRRAIETSSKSITPSPRLMYQASPPAVSQPNMIPMDTTPNIPATDRTHKYNTRSNVAKHGAYAIVDKDTGKSLEYRHLKVPKYK